MQKLVIATHNKDKLSEIKAVLSELPLDIVSIDEVIVGFDVIEDKDTILENAAKKALETSVVTGLPALADDTGLFIEALNNEPGVFAARFAGAGCTYADNRRKALNLLQDSSNRKAVFKTVIVLAEPDGVVTYKEGTVEGIITTEDRGSNGFGYDAVFEVTGTGKTYAEMDSDEKNACSHRGKALREIIPFLIEYFCN
ncbi:MAG: RdgB/HAM1 family non-canonical purine NTP pyrophosphatase [Candidatus Cloacimonetes bacterium]|nr:RdgB/HAM1 family non-canonical purine NTP pyrophosphatase [Candidatus Cloacimonadota bacterium]